MAFRSTGPGETFGPSPFLSVGVPRITAPPAPRAGPPFSPPAGNFSATPFLCAHAALPSSPPPFRQFPPIASLFVFGMSSLSNIFFLAKYINVPPVPYTVGRPLVPAREIYTSFPFSPKQKKARPPWASFTGKPVRIHVNLYGVTGRWSVLPLPRVSRIIPASVVLAGQGRRPTAAALTRPGGSAPRDPPTALPRLILVYSVFCCGVLSGCYGERLRPSPRLCLLHAA